MQSTEPLVVRKSERMATRQKKREQEQKKKREQEEKEAEAEDFLLARRVEDGQVRPWSQESELRLRIQDVEDAIKNSPLGPQGQIWHQRYVVEAKEELERREAEKERMEAELEEEERRQMEEEEEERRLLSERKRGREKSRERVKHSISKLSIQVNSCLNVTKPVVEDERRMQIQTELAAEQLEARLDQVGEGPAAIMEELTPRRMELEALPEVDRVRRQLDERLAELDIEDQLDVEREKKQVKASEEKTRARQKKREQATLKFEERMEHLLGKIWAKLAKDIESARREEKEIEELSGYPIDYRR